MFQFPRFAFVPYGFGKQIPSFDICKSESWTIGATCVANTAQNSDLQISKVGCPIRKFTDHCLFAAPHDLSQRTTSFIASQRQGIHRIPLRHLIALIINAHRSAAVGSASCKAQDPRHRYLLKTSLLQTYPRTLRSSDAHSGCPPYRRIASTKDDRT